MLDMGLAVRNPFVERSTSSTLATPLARVMLVLSGIANGVIGGCAIGEGCGSSNYRQKVIALWGRAAANRALEGGALNCT